MTIFNLHATLLAGLATATDALDFHAQLAGSIKHQGSVFNLTTAS